MTGYTLSAYERKARFDPTEDIEVLVKHGLSKNSSLIDFGAGTGTFVFAAAALGVCATAIDVSPQMIAAMQIAQESIEGINVEIVQAGFLSYRHTGDSVDFIYSRNALHQIPDFWKGIALQRVRDCLRTGGIFRFKDLVFDFIPAEAETKIEAWMSGAVDDSKKGFTANELAEHVKSEFSTYSWLIEPMIERTGFKILERHFRRSAYATYTCRAI